MRDRLFDLIAEMLPEDVPIDYLPDVDAIVDRLLAEGVIVPPCKVGDYAKIKGDGKVWRVDAFHFYREGVAQVSITNRKVTNTMSLETFEEFMEVLTKEEAEKALAERNGSV